ncbi:SRSF protein kinase 1 isoform X3 [Gallus gallus]|uniref:SRSF protein kinase 1 isoform X3 n=1 Tax=Gallus gallus TaxID=9031 RepID=UPI001AE3EB33|nr:SRSF protein kinase 1 isoform X3 [Gallus gallus]
MEYNAGDCTAHTAHPSSPLLLSPLTRTCWGTAMEEQVQEDVPEVQHTGGHHPVREGEVFNARYQALRELGSGAFATVWLCQDMRKKKNVAVKVLKSREGFAEAAQDELSLLRCVNNMKKKDQAGENIICLLDDFRMIGENGFHMCLVFEALGPSLQFLLGNYAAQGLPLPFVKKSLQQVLAGLHFLHGRCRIIHADIKPENVLLYIHDKNLHRFLLDGAECGQGTDLRLKAPGGDPGNQLEDSDLMSMEVKIADLGSACWTYKPFSKEIQTQPYRALEVLLGLDYGTPADIWSTACLITLLALLNSWEESLPRLLSPGTSQQSFSEGQVLFCGSPGSFPAASTPSWRTGSSGENTRCLHLPASSCRRCATPLRSAPRPRSACSTRG